MIGIHMRNTLHLLIISTRIRAMAKSIAHMSLYSQKNITFPHEILNGRIDPVYNIDNYVKEAKLKLQHAHEQARQTIEKIKRRTKEYYDKSSNPINVKIGDIVKIVSETNNKFLDRYKGPYKVIAIDDTNEIIQLDNTEYKIHKDRTRKY